MGLLSWQDDDKATTPLETHKVDGPRLCAVVIVGGVASNHPLPATGEVVIGRAEDADLCVDHPSISRRHALLRIDERITLQDLGSQNGSRVREVPLEPGSTA